MRHLLVSQSSALPPWGDFRRSERTVGHRRLGIGVSVVLSLGFRVRGSTLELESEEKKKDTPFFFAICLYTHQKISAPAAPEGKTVLDSKQPSLV